MRPPPVTISLTLTGRGGELPTPIGTRLTTVGGPPQPAGTEVLGGGEGLFRGTSALSAATGVSAS